MSSISTIDNIIMTEPLPSFKNPIKTGYKHFKNGLGFVAKEIGDGGTVNTVAKFARRFFEFLAIFEPLTPFVSVPANFLKNFSELFKVLGIFKNTHDVLTAKKVINLVRSVLGVTICAMSIAKLVEAFRWINLGKVATSFGKIPVLGAASVVPLGTVMGWLEALKAAIDISIAIKNLINLSKKVDKINQKKNFWVEPLTEKKCEKRIYKYEAKEAVLTKEIDQLQKEKATAFDKAEKWNEKREGALQTRKDKLEQQNKVRRCFTKSSNLLRKVVLRKEDRKLKKWLQINQQLEANLKTKNEALGKITQKKIGWASIGTTLHKVSVIGQDSLKEDLDKINTMKEAKLNKWKFKKSNVRLQQFKESMSVFVNGAVIVMVTGSTVLFFIGLFGTPVGGAVVPILLPTLGLVIAGVGVGMLFFKRSKGKEIKGVELPKLSNEDPVKRMLQKRQLEKNRVDLVRNRMKKAILQSNDDNLSVVEKDTAPAA